jgi:hypothetical protein
MNVTGYLHRSYAESLSEFGTPSILPKSGGWILKRQIPGFPYLDAMGCYPLFACQNWSQLDADLEEVREKLVSLLLVTAPFGGFDIDCLRQCFEDVFIPFKEHFVVDLSRNMYSFVSYHHCKYASRGFTKDFCHNLREPNPVYR